MGAFLKAGRRIQGKKWFCFGKMKYTTTPDTPTTIIRQGERMTGKSIPQLQNEQKQLETILEQRLQENQKLLSELDMLKGIVEKKRFEFLNKSDRDKFLSQTLKEGI